MQTVNETPTETKDVPVTEQEPTSTPEALPFCRKTVESLGGKVRLTDQDKEAELDLFCYVKCGSGDSELLKQCRGVVFHGDEVVMKAFPYTVEYNHTEEDEIKEALGGSSLKGLKIFESHEGALIRMFNFKDRWYTATHRKLSAFRSKWASRESFGSTFKKALEEEIKRNDELRAAIPQEGESILERFQSVLDPTRQYMFLVRNTAENRIVCDPPELPTMFHVGTFINGELDVEDDSIPVTKPRKLREDLGLTSVAELSLYVAGMDPTKLQGLIVFGDDNKQFKILNKTYQKLFRVRGNEPSLRFRYLQIRMDAESSDLLYRLYPDMAKEFEECENILYAVAKMIYDSYVQRYIKKKFITVPKEEFAVMKACHQWHEKDRANHRVSLETVIETMNKQTPTSLNRMQRRFRVESAKASQEVPATPPILSPLLLSTNPKRNPAAARAAKEATPEVPPVDLGPPAQQQMAE